MTEKCPHCLFHTVLLGDPRLHLLIWVSSVTSGGGPLLVDLGTIRGTRNQTWVSCLQGKLPYLQYCVGTMCYALCGTMYSDPGKYLFKWMNLSWSFFLYLTFKRPMEIPPPNMLFAWYSRCWWPLGSKSFHLLMKILYFIPQKQNYTPEGFSFFPAILTLCPNIWFVMFCKLKCAILLPSKKKKQVEEGKRSPFLCSERRVALTLSPLFWPTCLYHHLEETQDRRETLFFLPMVGLSWRWSEKRPSLLTQIQAISGTTWNAATEFINSFRNVSGQRLPTPCWAMLTSFLWQLGHSPLWHTHRNFTEAKSSADEGSA